MYLRWYVKEIIQVATCLVTYDRCAREPDMTDAKQVHQVHMEDLKRKMAERGVCARV